MSSLGSKSRPELRDPRDSAEELESQSMLPTVELESDRLVRFLTRFCMR